MTKAVGVFVVWCCACWWAGHVLAEVSDAERAALVQRATALQAKVDRLRPTTRDWQDIAICAKAIDWILRHNEFHKPDYLKLAQRTLDVGEARANLLLNKRQPLSPPAGTRTVLAYVSKVDGSLQPYSMTLPTGYDATSSKKWPLHIDLHGRGDTMNEAWWIAQHEGKAPKEAGQSDFVVLEPWGRGNNAYRWSGETDVLEALENTLKRFSIDEARVTLRGFSMGGAGAWHLGLHHSDRWSSVGAGAGFVDTVRHMNLKEPLSDLHHKLTGIYDAERYALNAFNVPIIGYGGELDKQIYASQTMHRRAKEQGLDVPALVGPNTEHKFHPDSLREFMAFHAKATATGRPNPMARKEIRLTAYSLRHAACDWLAIEKQTKPLEETTITAQVVDDGQLLRVTTHNVAAFRVSRSVATSIEIDGEGPLVLEAAAQQRLPDVYFVKQAAWRGLDYESSRAFQDNREGHKRPGLQGPIDDAFMDPYLCVMGTGTPWNPDHEAWSRWSLARFEREYDKYLRAKVPVIKDTELTPEQINRHHLVVWGDPGSNSVLQKALRGLPITWTKDALILGEQTYNPNEHGVALIGPNPLNPRRYLVINSGHTFHEKDFKASNASLYPKLGDVAVLKFSRKGSEFQEEVLRAGIRRSDWSLPELN